jgi:hypothetical protein
MKRVLLLTLLIIISEYTYSQVEWSQSPKTLNKKFDDWYEGKVLLKNGDSLSCPIAYSPLIPGGLLKVKSNEVIKTYTPQQVESFSFFDETNHKTSTFITLPALNNRPSFFEVLYESRSYSILGEKTIKINKTNYDLVTGVASTYTTSVVRGKYLKYILDVHDWKFYELSKYNIYRLMHDKEKELKKYAKTNHLKLKKTEDCTRMIEEYNRLKTI